MPLAQLYEGRQGHRPVQLRRVRRQGQLALVPRDAGKPERLLERQPGLFLTALSKQRFPQQPLGTSRPTRVTQAFEFGDSLLGQLPGPFASPIPRAQE